MKNEEVHITKTSKIKRRPKDVKADVDMVDANTLKQISPTNPHVLEITPQVLGIINHVLEVQSLELQISEVQVSEVQVSKVQVSDIETSQVQVSEVDVSDIELSKVHVSDIHVSDIQVLNIHISDIQVHISIF